ncbi:MAG: hypothetical protein D6719_01535 [Candidatus Dadabacteria bacterium]|nr:MAG: hypothetical protein D6719_01535 [Candidatus Dadabacteria bacterium]
MYRKFAAVILCLLVLTGPQLVQAASTPHDFVKVKLISNVSRVEAGKEFYVGALFELKPGWHIYWKHPGESGLPTSVKFAHTDDLEIGELKWPEHEQFKQGELTANGYSDSVLLFAPFKVKARSTGDKITVMAKIKWLGCNGSLCVPGRKTEQIELPLGSLTKSSEDKLFRKWFKKVED